MGGQIAKLAAKLAGKQKIIGECNLAVHASD